MFGLHPKEGGSIPPLLTNRECKMKICRDCRFYKRSWISPFSDRFAKCMFLTKEESEKINLVSGKPNTKELKFCETERDFDCGKEGKNFEYPIIFRV